MLSSDYSPSTKTVSFGPAPDPYTDPAGFAAWFNNVENAMRPTVPSFKEWNASQSSPVVLGKDQAGYSKAAKSAAFAQYKSLYPDTNSLETKEYVFERPQDAGLLTDYVNGAGIGGTAGHLTEEAVKANIARDPLYYANVLAGTQAGIAKNSTTPNAVGLNTKSISGMLLPSNVETLPTTDFGQLLAQQGSGTDYLLTPEQLYGQLYSGDQYKNYVGEAVPDALRSVFGTSDAKLYPNQQIRIVDQNGVIHSGTAAEMAEASQGQFSADALGDKLYAYQVQNPASGDWSTVYTHVPEGPSWLENFAMMAGPALGAALLPMFAPAFMGLSSAGTAALGAGLGSTAAGAATGKGIGDIAKNAALSAALTYAGGSLFGGGNPSGASDAAINANVNNALNQLYTGTQAGIASALSPVYGTALAGTGAPLTGGIGSALSGAGSVIDDLGEILVTGTRNVAPALSGAPVAGAVGTNLFNPYQSYNPESIQTRTPVDTATDDLVITAKVDPTKVAVPDYVNSIGSSLGGLLGGAGASSSPSGTNSTTNNTTTGDEILVTAQREIPDWIKDIALTAGVFAPAAAISGSSAGAAGSATDATVSANTQNAVDNAYFNAQQGAAEALSPTYGGAAAGAGAGAAAKGLAALSTADKIRLALAAGSAISGIVDSLGGGDSGGSIGPNGGRYDVTPINRTQNLRTPVGAGLGDYGFDPFTYGQADGGQPGEYLFFSPAAAAATAGMAKGGKVKDKKLHYEDLSPEEKNAVDYHRRNLAADMVRHNDNGSGSSYIGVVNELNGKETYYPTLWNGKELPRAEAEKRVIQSGIAFPTYPDYETGVRREKRIHDDIMAPEMDRYLKGDRSFLEGYAEGGEPSDDMLKHLIEYRKGGGHNGPGAVKGIGSGQDDKIPAWLSDGEYVWSAQDVADLGDGSTDEGVRRLDKMRQMVRKQAGRKNVKQIAKPQKGVDHLLSAVGGK